MRILGLAARIAKVAQRWASFSQFLKYRETCVLTSDAKPLCPKVTNRAILVDATSFFYNVYKGLEVFLVS